MNGAGLFFVVMFLAFVLALVQRYAEKSEKLDILEERFGREVIEDVLSGKLGGKSRQQRAETAYLLLFKEAKLTVTRILSNITKKRFYNVFIKTQ